MTGTPEGVGYAIRAEDGPPQFLREGDDVQIFVEGLGTQHGIKFA